MKETICLFISVISLILVVFTLILFFRKNKKYKRYEIFEFDVSKSCEGQLIKKTNNHCPKTNFNGIYYTFLDWKKLSKSQTATLYFTKAENKNIVTINYWLSIYEYKLKTVSGTMRWTSCYIGDPTIIKSNISAASGTLQEFQNENVWIDFTNKKIVRIYTFTNNLKSYIINKYNLSNR